MKEEIKILIESLKILSERETEILSNYSKTEEDLKELSTINSLRNDLLDNLFSHYEIIPIANKETKEQFNSKIMSKILKKLDEKEIELQPIQYIQYEGEIYKVAQITPKNLKLPQSILNLNTDNQEEPLESFFKYSNIDSKSQEEPTSDISPEPNLEEITNIKSPSNKEDIEKWHRKYGTVINLTILVLLKVAQEKNLNKELISEKESSSPDISKQTTSIIGRTVQTSFNPYIYQTAQDAINEENKYKPFNDNTQERIVLGVSINQNHHLITVTAKDDNYNQTINDLLNDGGIIESLLLALKEKLEDFDGTQTLSLEEINNKAEGFYNIKDIIKNDFIERGIKR